MRLPILLVLVLPFLFSACGGGGSRSGSTADGQPSPVYTITTAAGDQTFAMDAPVEELSSEQRLARGVFAATQAAGIERQIALIESPVLVDSHLMSVRVLFVPQDGDHMQPTAIYHHDGESWSVAVTTF